MSQMEVHTITCTEEPVLLFRVAVPASLFKLAVSYLPELKQLAPVVKQMLSELGCGYDH